MPDDDTAPVITSIDYTVEDQSIALTAVAADEETLDGAVYDVDWGDGTTSSDGSATLYHFYDQPGRYAVIVRVTDSDGLTAIKASVVDIAKSVDLVVFADARLAALEVLRSNVSSIADGVTFGTRTPDVKGNGGPALPYVLVGHDATYGSSSVKETAVVRLAVWARSEATALAIAQRARAVLLAYGGGPAARGFGPLTGPIPTADPDSGTPLAYLTVAARLRPTAP